MPDDLIPTQEAAEVRGVSVGTVNRWVREGRLTPAAKAPGIRGAHLFHRSDVEAVRDLAAVAEGAG